jgi:hypothetical protein
MFRVERGGRVLRKRVGVFVEIMVKPTRFRRNRLSRVLPWSKGEAMPT